MEIFDSPDSMATTSSESDTDAEYENDDHDKKVYDAMDEENMSEDSGDQSCAYNIQRLDQNSLHGVSVVDLNLCAVIVKCKWTV